MNIKQWLPNLATLALAALLVITQQVWAGPLVARLASTPPASSSTVINYQGCLTDSEGNPVNGTLDMAFRFYDVPTGGTALWSENHNGVTVTDCLFSVLLGSVNLLPASLFDAIDHLWLGISAGGDQEMTPREQLGCASCAMTVPDGSITASKLIDGAVTEAKIADASITPAKLVSTLRYKTLTIPMFTRGYGHTENWGDGIVLANGGNSDAIGSIVLPDDFPNVDTDVVLRILFNSSGPGSLFKLRVRVKAQNYGHNNYGDDAFDVWNVVDRTFTRDGNDSWPGGQRRLWGETVFLNNSNLRPGRWLSVWVERKYDDPDDTFAGDVILRGVVLAYSSSAN